jgi:hypothetical protein
VRPECLDVSIHAIAWMSRCYRAGQMPASSTVSIGFRRSQKSLPPPSPRAQPCRTVAFVVARALATRATGRDDVAGSEARMRKVPLKAVSL